MPPALFTRSAHHSVPRSPAVPTGAAMPARIATMPIFTSLACARAISGKPPTLAAAPVAATPFRNVRLVFMRSSLNMGPSDPRYYRVVRILVGFLLLTLGLAVAPVHAQQ